MATELYTHPTPEQLRAFAQGRLSSAEMAELEKHIAYCDSCCLQLARIPDDTLVQLAREAATEGVKSPAKPKPTTPRIDPNDIPAELRDHPRYRVLGLVGTGGMGAVYKAEHRLMERLVALKVINPSLIANPQAVERFQREFRAAAKLSHPNIVAAHDADHAGELHFLVMEFVEGLGLDQLIGERGPLAPAEASNLIRQAALGLQHAHERGMVHRDIKPQNLKIIPRIGRVKILDFGLARLASERSFDRAANNEDRPARPGETTAGMILGTPDYIAPEQATDARSADIRADIYSLGCTLYYLLTAQPPFPNGTTIEKLNQHLNSPPPSILQKRPDVPAELARILEKMLAKNPLDRYQKPGEVAKELAPLARGQGGEGRSRPPGGTSAAPTGRESPAEVLAPQESATLVTKAPAGALVPVLSTEYSVLSTSLLDDIKLDGSLPTLPPVVQPPSGSGLPFGATPLVAILLACGVAAAIMLLAWGVAGALFSDDPTLTTAQQPAEASGSEHPTTESSLTQTIRSPPSSSGPPGPGPSETPPCPPTYAATDAIAENLPRKVLLVVPSRGLWANDYWRLKPVLESMGVDVNVASTSLNPPTQKDGSPTKIFPDLLLDENVRGEDYGAVIFAGYTTDEYHPGGSAGQQTSRLIREMREKGRIIASICVGQRVLDAHQLLDGRDVAHCHFLEKDFGGGRGNPKYQGVVEANQIITAGADSDGPDLAVRIASHLGRLRD